MGVVLWMQNQRRAPFILLYATGLAERGPIVLYNNSIPLNETGGSFSLLDIDFDYIDIDID